jgi:hypothetical protein
MITLVRVIASESDLNHSTIHNTEKLALFLLSSATTLTVKSSLSTRCHPVMLTWKSRLAGTITRGHVFVYQTTQQHEPFIFTDASAILPGFSAPYN